MKCPETFWHVKGALCHAERWIGFVTGSVIWTFRRDAISQSAVDCWWVSDSSVDMWIVSVVSRCHQYSCCRFCSLRCLVETSRDIVIITRCMCVYVFVRVRESPCDRVCILHVRGDHSEARAGGLSESRYLVTQLSETGVLKDTLRKENSNSLIKVTCHNWMNRNKYTIITPTKCTLLLLTAPDITICTLCHILPLHVSTRVGHLQGAQCQCLAKVIISYNLLKLC
jgi:hypothetical protein